MVLRELWRLGEKSVAAIASETVTIGGALLLVGAVALALRFLVVEWARRPEGGALPSAAVQPVSTSSSWVLFSLEAWVPSLSSLTRGLPPMVWLGFRAFIAFDLALLFGFLFFRPHAVGALEAVAAGPRRDGGPAR
jgi:hypothetical protein